MIACVHCDPTFMGAQLAQWSGTADKPPAPLYIGAVVYTKSSQAQLSCSAQLL